MFSVDKYLANSFRHRTYNCFDFVRDIWLELTGTDLGRQTPEESSISVYTEKALKVANTLIKLDSCEDPCIVLFQRARLEPHVGVYHKGKVLHLSRSGAYYIALDQVSAGYTNVSFYK